MPTCSFVPFSDFQDIEPQEITKDFFSPQFTSSPIPFDEDSSLNSTYSSSDDESSQLYKGSPLSQAEFMVKFNTIGSRLQLSNAAKSAILNFIAEVLPFPNKCPTFYQMQDTELPYSKVKTRCRKWSAVHDVD